MHHFLDHWSGGDGGFLYDLYSGLIALVGLAIVTAFLQLMRKKFQCHDSSCHKVGLHHVAGGEFVVCGKHYREVKGLHPEHKITIHHIKQAHEDHLDRISKNT